MKIRKQKAKILEQNLNFTNNGNFRNRLKFEN